ncbi:MAG: stage II sporulation protein R [Firmicutes bacterium]|nr:stage II sporulation protein R [Bacillota bacterium]
MRMTLTRLQKEVLLLLMISSLFGSAAVYGAQHPANEHPGMIRLHVIANSDTPEDQMIKRKVRNEIIAAMEGQTDLEGARTYIDQHLTEMEDKAEMVISDCGAEYSAKAERKVTFIPEKSYEDLTLPAGNYEALRITLGEGKGQNWWCVIFPQLCLIGEDDGGEKLVLKSKIKEMLKNQ